MISTETHANENIHSLSEYIPRKKFVLSPGCPVTTAEFNWLFKQRASNGFAKAFVKFSARGFLVHIPTFIECLKAKRGV